MIKECKDPSSPSWSSSNSSATSVRRPRCPDASLARQRSTRSSGLRSDGSLVVLRMRSIRCRQNHDQAGNGSRNALGFLPEGVTGCWWVAPFRRWVAVAHYQGRSFDREMQAAAEIRAEVGTLAARAAGLVIVPEEVAGCWWVAPLQR